jgi:hypothetical protein
MVLDLIAAMAPTRFVTFHGGNKTFARKTLKSMITQACWTEDDLKRLKLIS